MSWTYTDEYYKQYTRDTWNESADVYPTILANLAKYTPDLLDVAEPQPGQRVLDVATGPGEPALTIARVVGADGHVTGVDLAERMIEAAKRNAIAENLKNVDFQVMDAESMTFDDATFDLVVCRFGLQIFTDPEAALAEFHRVLKPRGRLAASVWASPGERVPAIHIAVEPMLAYAEPDETGYIPTPYEMGGAGEMVQLLAAAGFSEATETRATHDWAFDDEDAYFHAILKGSPLGHSLEEEDADVQKAVMARARERVKEWVTKEGRVVAPGEAVLVGARK